jgi:hypothetical protein
MILVNFFDGNSSLFLLIYLLIWIRIIYIKLVYTYTHTHTIQNPGIEHQNTLESKYIVANHNDIHNLTLNMKYIYIYIYIYIYSIQKN